jgi:2',3'-cyclic-nucleotide 2'-phosphodiesterase (5'-nucleotidase family)
VDAGGFFPEDDVHMPASWFLMDAMKVLHTDAVGCSDRELRFGLQYLQAQIKRTGLPVLSANLFLKASKRPALQPYIIKDVNGIKVGIFGLMSDKADVGPARDSIYVVEPSNVATETIKEMRRKGATVIVLLSQLGKIESEDLVTAVDGVDAIMVGRNVPMIQTGRMIKNTVACYGGEQGQYLGRTILTLGPKNKVVNGSNELFILGPEVGEKKEVADLVREFEDGFNAMLARKEKENAASAALADSTKNAPDHFLGSETCIRCHAPEGEQWKKTAHANAWATLVERRKDSTPDCVPCHVLGYKQPGGYGANTTGANMTNVQCENCHGMGTQHDGFAAAPHPVQEGTCLTCHTSSTSPEFSFAKFKPYIDHTHMASDLPPLNTKKVMK